MVRLTLLARITDGLPLAEGLEDDQNHDLLQFKQQAKACSIAIYHVIKTVVVMTCICVRLEEWAKIGI